MIKTNKSEIIRHIRLTNKGAVTVIVGFTISSFDPKFRRKLFTSELLADRKETDFISLQFAFCNPEDQFCRHQGVKLARRRKTIMIKERETINECIKTGLKKLKTHKKMPSWLLRHLKQLKKLNCLAVPLIPQIKNVNELPYDEYDILINSNLLTNLMRTAIDRGIMNSPTKLLEDKTDTLTENLDE